MRQLRRLRSSRSRGSGARFWDVIWLPVLLVGLVIVLEPLVGGFVLGFVLLMFALATTWLPDLVRKMRRARRQGRS